MKILLNVPLERLETEAWIECEAVKFVEAIDGSFDLHVTSDLKKAKKSDAEMAALVERMKA